MNFLHKYRVEIAVALALTFASGTVDIVGYEGVYHYFTAHLTGTTVHLGTSLVMGKTVDILAAIAILCAFLAGSVFGRAVIEIGSRKQIKKLISFTLALEIVLLVAAIYLSRANSQQPYVKLALLAGAMGLQTASLTGIGPLTVHTTFVTGMVNKLAQLTSRIGFGAYDRWKSHAPNPTLWREQKKEMQMAAFLLGIWLCYLAGAAFGAWSVGFWRLHALFVPVGLLAASVAVDQIYVLSIKEEQEQSER